MAIASLRQVWRTLREVDLAAIKAEAEQPFQLLLVGDAGQTRDLAARLSQTPGRSGLHPWIELVAGSDVGALTEALRRGAQLPQLALLVGAELEPAPALLEALRKSDVPAVTLVLSEAAALQVGAEVPRPGEAGRALLPPQADPDTLRASLGPALMSATPEGRGLRLALARQLPLLRAPFVEDLIEDVARSNATYAFSTGLGEVVPGVGLALGLADIFILTKNQLVMAYKVALAAGREGSSRELMAEVAGVIGGGLLFRQIARELVGLIPVIGIVPKVVVAYAGTRLIGSTVWLWADEGERIDVSELRGLYAEALSGGRKLADQLLQRRGDRRASR